MDTTQLLKAFEVIALLLAGAVSVVWQLRSTERDLRRSRAQRRTRPRAPGGAQHTRRRLVCSRTPGMCQPAQRDRPAHGMAQHHPRPGQRLQGGPGQERLQVPLVFGEILDMAEQSVDPAFGQALAAPIQGGDGEAHGGQPRDDAEIFLDVFGAALQNDDRALASGWRLPAAEPQFDSVRRFDSTGEAVVWHRIGGDRDEFHERR